MQRELDFTKGPILVPLMRFTLPIMAALVLQALYGAVDLMVVGKFAVAADVSAVSTGSQVMHSVTAVITGLAMGVTVLMGHQFGQNDREAAGRTMGSGVALFAVLSAVLTIAMLAAAPALVRLMKAPAEAYAATVDYVMICSGGVMCIAAYNLLGSIFRGMGDARTPLLAVAMACGANIVLDLLFVAVFGMGAAGAALATVLAQGISVGISLLVIRRRGLPFPFGKAQLRPRRAIVGRIVRLGAPCALQDLLVSISFLVILAIINGMGLIASAGAGVAEKLCLFIMLVPSAYMQAMSAYVAQNIGAGQPERARRGMGAGMATSFLFGAFMGWLAFFHGDILAQIFMKAEDTAVIAAAADYLRAYAVDTLLVCFLFCFIGYFNGCGRTAFVMVQGLAGAFFVRIPVSYFTSRMAGATLFHIGLATPCSTVVQILLCLWYFRICLRGEKREAEWDRRSAPVP